MNVKIDPSERRKDLAAENADLRYRLETAEDRAVKLAKRANDLEVELAKTNEENQNLRMLLKDTDVERRLLGAQMDVVRLIFGKGGCNG